MGGMTESVVQAWHRLAVHADACDVCLPFVQRRARADDPRRADGEIHPHLCAEGGALHGDLIAVEGDYLAGTLEARRRLGVLGASQEAVELRDAAWAQIPDADRLRVLGLGDHERFALLESLEAGILARRRRGAPVDQEELTERPCAGCGVRFAPEHPRQRYHSAACRKRAWQATS